MRCDSVYSFSIEGKPLTVKCGVSDSQSGGVFTWKIGDEVIQSSGERKEADDRIINSVEFVPEKKVGEEVALRTYH